MVVVDSPWVQTFESHLSAPSFKKSTRRQGDPSLAAIAITNGLRNTVEAYLAVAQDQRPKITINWDATDRDYWVTILDEGIGFPRNIEGAFEIGNGTKGHLGHRLPSVRAAIQCLSGRIELIPQDDKGCAPKSHLACSERCEVWEGVFERGVCR